MMARKRVGHRKARCVNFGRCFSIICGVMAFAMTFAPAGQAQVTNLTNGGTISLANLGTGNFSILVGDKLFSDFGIVGYNASNIVVKGIIENGNNYGIQFQGGFFSMNGSMELNLSYAVAVTNS